MNLLTTLDARIDDDGTRVVSLNTRPTCEAASYDVSISVFFFRSRSRVDKPKPTQFHHPRRTTDRRVTLGRRIRKNA